MAATKALKQLRLEKGWTQEQLAEISGVSVRTIQRIEQGAPAGLESAKALAAAFGLPFADLHLNGKEEPMTDASPAPADSIEQLIVSLKRQCQSPEQQRRRFRHHLVTYALVIGGLAYLNLRHNSDYLWVFYPAIFWGLFLMRRGLNLYGPGRHKAV